MDYTLYSCQYIANTSLTTEYIIIKLWGINGAETLLAPYYHSSTQVGFTWLFQEKYQWYKN